MSRDNRLSRQLEVSERPGAGFMFLIPTSRDTRFTSGQTDWSHGCPVANPT